ncbi:hypothetical protein CICLE_v10003051mg [Citrus x clementina]|uniref:Uncharacterized protein n=2 Tax=Citrus TaxID=2706 RepID=A0A067GV48_CITSI|nr:hypothetical protein CICLE_v10003051mg [Citrus x clementina]KDO83504.1 hypothetical protein CISIN_1g045426mg [Citrus sinensis]
MWLMAVADTKKAESHDDDQDLMMRKGGMINASMREHKGSLLLFPPARGGIKRRIFTLFYKQLKLAALHLFLR